MRKLFATLPILWYILISLLCAMFVCIIVGGDIGLINTDALDNLVKMPEEFVLALFMCSIFSTIIFVLVLITKITNLTTGAVLPGICCVIFDLVILGIVSATLQSFNRDTSIYYYPVIILMCSVLLCNIISIKGKDA